MKAKPKVTLNTLAVKIETLTGNLDSLAIMLNRQFENFDKRFDGIDKRFNEIDGVLMIHSTRFDNLESSIKDIKVNVIGDLSVRVSRLEKKEGILS